MDRNGEKAAYAERASLLFRIAALVKRYADQYQLAVVCVNQVSDVITATNGTTKNPVSAAILARLAATFTQLISLWPALHI